MRGASRGVLKCGARPVAVPRSGLRLQTPAGGPRDLVLRVTMTRASNEVGARSRRECRTTASTGPGRKIATVERREAGVSLRWKRWASKARRPRAGHGTHYRVLAHPGACRRSAIPSSGWRIGKARSKREKKEKTRRRKRKRKKREIWGAERFVGWARAHAENGSLATRSVACAVPTRSTRASADRVGTARKSAPLPTLHCCVLGERTKPKRPQSLSAASGGVNFSFSAPATARWVTWPS